MDYYLNIKKNEILSFVAAQMELEVTNVKWNKPDTEQYMCSLISQSHRRAEWKSGH